MVENRLSDRERHEPVTLLYGEDGLVEEWVRNQLDMNSGFGECTAIGAVYKDRLIAGVVYYCYRHPNIEMAIAAISPRWATKTTLRAFFEYPFDQLGCNRVTVLVDSDKAQVRRFDERLGFIREGTLREANPNGDAEIYGMLKNECRWI
ncbi:MAG: GNAT family N-acetyltransferase [Pseudomonadales bacterium]|nr:GNAT family N-acetyltransferase [Pseudomonadales bacterium]